MSLTTPLVRLRVLPALLPVDGRNADLRISPDGLWLQKRIGDNAPWENVAPISSLQGEPGPETEFRTTSTYIQHRPKLSGAQWQDLLPLSTIMGPGPVIMAGAATPLPTGSDPTISISNDMGVYKIDLGIPAGPEGAPGSDSELPSDVNMVATYEAAQNG